MRKLIIGCGYLGGRVARAWLDRGDHVSALTRSHRRAEVLRAAGIEPVIGDVLDPASLSKLPDVETLLYAVGYDRDSAKSQREVNKLRGQLSEAEAQIADEDAGDSELQSTALKLLTDHLTDKKSG